MKKTPLRVISGLLITLIAVILYSMTTERGLHWMIAGLNRAVPGHIEIDRARGSFLGPMSIGGVEYRSEDLRLQIRHMEFDWRPGALFGLRFHVSRLHADGIEIQPLSERRDADDGAPMQLESLPVKLLVDDVTISDVQVYPYGGTEPLAVDQIALQARTTRDGLQIDRFTIAARGFALNLHGTVGLEKQQAGKVWMDWWIQPSQVSGIGDGGRLRGELVVEGLTTDYRFHGSGGFQATGFPMVHYDVEGYGDTTQIMLSLLHADAEAGTIDAAGFVQWTPNLQWKFAAMANELNPGFFAPEWSGNLTFQADTKGARIDDVLNAQLVVDPLTGTLQGQPLTGRMEGRIAGERFALPELTLSVGPARVSAAGTVNDAWDFQWRIAADNLGLLIPDAQGELQAQGEITGPRSTPIVTASVDAGKLRLDRYRAGELKARVDLDLTDQRRSEIDVTGSDIGAGSRYLDGLQIRAAGKRIHHTVEFAIDEAQQRLQGSLTAKLDDAHWTGSITDMRFHMSDVRTWSLRQPAPFVADGVSGRLEELCLADAASQVCAKGDWQLDTGWNGALTVQNMPLALAQQFVDEEISVDGSVNARVQAGYGRQTGLQGSARIELTPGRVKLNDGEATHTVLEFGQGNLTADLENDEMNAALVLPLMDNGSIAGELRMSDLSSPDGWLHPRTRIDSRWRVHFVDNGLVSLFEPGLSTSKGRVDVDVAVKGSLGDPLVSGNAALRDAQVLIPQIGVQLTGLHIQVTGDGNTITFNGGTQSGEGVATVKGRFTIAGGEPLSADVALTGEDLLAVNIPEAIVTASPDLRLTVRGRRVDVSGKVRIPEARIRLWKLQETAAESDDLVVLRAGDTERGQDQWRIYSRISVLLDDKVGFDGFGLSGNIQGNVTVVDEPEQTTTGQGELKIAGGKYKLYGQKLDIEKGRLIFAGGPVEDPGLDIRVTRKTGAVLAGVRITGTAESPVLNMFSEPAMAQSDTLSYLLLGRPTNQASGAEGALLTNAAASLGLSGGDLLARKLGKTFGIEDVQIESGNTVEESSLVLGKYLSPRMYINYAVGLFDHLNTFRIRYSLTKRWVVQTESGAASGADLLWSIER